MEQLTGGYSISLIAGVMIGGRTTGVALTQVALLWQVALLEAGEAAGAENIIRIGVSIRGLAMRVIIMRHGDAVFQGAERVLSSRGEQEARLTGLKLVSAFNITKIFCSSKRRAQQTAQIVHGLMRGCNVPEVQVLNELNPYGDASLVRDYLDAVCEPSDREIIAAHMGFIFFRVEVKGVSVHSGSKWNGVSAIDKTIKIINAINELEHNWLMRYKHPLLPSPNLNVGVISGGKAGSTVPDYCKFETCVHYLPNIMTHEQVVKEFTETVNMCAMGDSWLRDNMPKISIYQSGGGFEMDLNDPFVDVFKKSYEDIYNKGAKIVGSPAGCDARTWRNIAKCPTLQYGPGSIKQCHTVNEYLDIEEYLESILLYANIILNFAKQ